MVNSHADLAIPPEMHFLIERRPALGADEFLSMLLSAQTWDDFRLSPATLHEAIGRVVSLRSGG